MSAARANVPPIADAVVVGAGFAGLYAIYKLRSLGLEVHGFEAGSGVGGTWFWNRYPGARCDAPSLDYSFSFSDELQQEWDWSERYATQPEILAYLEHVADRFALRDHITFNARVTAAHYLEAERLWQVRTDCGDVTRARYCVMASGCLSTPRLPDIPGVETFAGTNYHTTAWPADADLAGKRVGVIGTGSSAIQLIPIVAEEAAELTVFQRTPVYSIPAGNRPITAGELAAAKATYAERRVKARTSPNGLPVDISALSALEVEDLPRFMEYDRCWHDGTPILFPYNDLFVSQAANDTAGDFIKHKIRSIVLDPEAAAALSAQDFPLGAKRLALDTGYYETYNRPHVHLVDLRATPIIAIDADGVRTSEQHVDLDVLIFATGFDAMTGALRAMDIVGESGLALTDVWSEGPRANLGVSVAGFPNLFLITGPGSPSVLSNVPMSIEQHVEWVADLLVYMREHDLTTAVSAPEAQEEWVTHVNTVADYTLFPKAASWYMGANIPGKPRVFMPYVGGVGAFREKCQAVADAGYPGFILS